MSKRLSHLMFLFILVAVVIAGCDSRHPAEKVVDRMYKALSKGDMSGYMDTILPQNRQQLNPFGLLSAMSFSVGPVGFDVSKLMAVSIRDLKLKTLSLKDNYALIQAEGYVRYPVFMMEVRFCDQHDVRLQDGEWYVDVYAPERAERLERILGIRQQELEAMARNAPPASGQPEDELLTALGMLGPSMEKALNLCDTQQR